MRHFRLPQLFQTVPASVQDFPAALHRSSPRQRLILSGLGIVAVMALIWFLTLPGGRTRPPPPPVRVATAQQQTMLEVENTIGTVVANATVNLSAQVDGKVESAEFHEGDIVHKGDVLFRLDARPFQAALEKAKADLARDRAQLVTAQRNRARYEKLFRQNAISAEQRDQALAQAGSLAGTVNADQAAVDIAKLNLDYAVIRAPVDGKTGPILIQPGNLVKANTNTLVVITQIQPIKVSFSLPQTDLPRVQQQMAAGKLIARITPHGDGARALEAPVDFVDNAVNNQTGTIQLRVSFPNKDGRLVPGELVDVSVNLNEIKNAIVVPSQAINVGPNGHYVWVLAKNDIAAMRAVKVLFDDGTNSAIAGKVSAGDTVITVGQLRVIPGAPVLIVHDNEGEGASAESP